MEDGGSVMCIRNRSVTLHGHHQVSWGVDLASEHERYLTEEVFQQPVIVYNYPKEIKARSMFRLPLIQKTARKNNTTSLRPAQTVGWQAWPPCELMWAASEACSNGYGCLPSAHPRRNMLAPPESHVRRA